MAYASYVQQVKHGIRGIGFVLTPEDPYVAVDIDSCVQEQEIEAQAARIIEELKSYTEISPSGHGIRILIANPEFHDNARTAAIEACSHSRYVTVTIASLLPPSEQASKPPPHAKRPEQFPVGDTELWERIFAHDKYGQQHLQRFYGDTTLDQGDHSFTVIRLLNCLARWT